MGGDERENFTGAVRQIIAGRAGYRCSFPTCGRVTIGPGATARQTASNGVACHIFSAAPNGPRGQGGLTADQLKDVENGFWACEDHAKLVDTNEGKRYPAATLLGWRALHEARIHLEMGGIRLPVNWIEGIEIISSPDASSRSGPMFKPGQRLNLSRVTLLLGDNASGKTALCEWIGATAEEGSLARWMGADLSFALTIHNPDAHIFTVKRCGEEFCFHLDGAAVPFNPLPVVVQVLGRLLPRGEAERDVDWMARWLGVTPGVVERLARGFTQERNPFVESMNVADDGAIEATLRVTGERRTFGALSGSEKVLVGLGLAVARASTTSRYAPTLFLFDEGLSAFDPANKTLILTELGRMVTFQSVATLPMEDPKVIWSGWSVVRIEDDPGGALITGD